MFALHYEVDCHAQTDFESHYQVMSSVGDGPARGSPMNKAVLNTINNVGKGVVTLINTCSNTVGKGVVTVINSCSNTNSRISVAFGLHLGWKSITHSPSIICLAGFSELRSFVRVLLPAAAAAVGRFL
jgi:hypothetical protein